MKKKNDNEEERSAAADQVLNRPRRSLSDILPGGQGRNTITFEEGENEEVSRSLKRRASVPADHDSLGEKHSERKRRFIPFLTFFNLNFLRRKPLIYLISVLVLIPLFYSVLFVLPRADLMITLKQNPWEYQGDISAALSGGDISAQVLSQTKNITMAFDATGKKYGEAKAAGVIKIFNGYKPVSQPLVATTRFISPDGKVFRLDKSVTVPAAKVVNGELQPQSVDAPVTADQPGVDYNVGPVTKWLIPGFKGSPKYEGFYGVSESAMVGGGEGKHLYPTPDDIKNAKTETEKKLKDALSASFNFQVPKEFSILDNSSSSNFKITKSSVVGGVNDSGKFSYLAEAKDSRVAVKDDDIKKYFIAKALGELGRDFVMKNADLSYSFKKNLLKADNTISGAVLAINFKGSFVKDINFDDLKSKILGKSESDLRTLIFSVSGIQSAKVSLWPFWVKTVPQSSEKVNLVIE